MTRVGHFFSKFANEQTVVTRGEASTPLIDKVRAVEILGTMLGGYNIEPLIACLDDDETAPAAVAALSGTLLVFDAFHDVVDKSEAGNPHARKVLESWANADWFTSKPPLADKITVTVFKVPGETNTDDLSPAQDAWSRPDIPGSCDCSTHGPADEPRPQVGTLPVAPRRGRPRYG